MNRVCVVYNHSYPGTVDTVRRLNAAFGEVVVVTPPGGGGDVEYYSGSYTWQAAVVEYLKATPASQQGHTLVVGDDVVINPAIDPFGELAGSTQSCLHQGLWSIAGPLPPAWQWNTRLALSFARSMHFVLGNGEEHPRNLLLGSDFFVERADEIGKLHQSSLGLDAGSLDAESWVGLALLAELGGEGGVDFGLPLFGGYSDVFTFPNAYAEPVLDFLKRTVRANFFVEVAIPTMLAWSWLEVISLGERLRASWGQDRDSVTFNGALEMWDYFETHHDVFAVHPVKLSRWSL